QTPVTAGRWSSNVNIQETGAEPRGGTVTCHVRVTSSATVNSASGASRVVVVSSASQVTASARTWGEGTDTALPPALITSMRDESGTTVTVTVSSVASRRRDSIVSRSPVEVVDTARSKITRSVESAPGSMWRTNPTAR